MILALCVFFAVRYWREPAGPLPPETADSLDGGLHRVVRVVDGDTLIVEPDHTIVRLIGVDTPETVKPDHPVEPLGPEAADFTRHFVAGGTVRLTFDAERLDRFGRHLAYVWVGDQLLNEELLRAGLARYEPHFRYADSMKSRFRGAQRSAQRSGSGLWAEGVDEMSDEARGQLPDESRRFRLLPLRGAWPACAIGYRGA